MTTENNTIKDLINNFHQEIITKCLTTQCYQKTQDNENYCKQAVKWCPYYSQTKWVLVTNTESIKGLYRKCHYENNPRTQTNDNK